MLNRFLKIWSLNYHGLDYPNCANSACLDGCGQFIKTPVCAGQLNMYQCFNHAHKIKNWNPFISIPLKWDKLRINKQPHNKETWWILSSLKLVLLKPVTHVNFVRQWGVEYQHNQVRFISTNSIVYCILQWGSGEILYNHTMAQRIIRISFVSESL